MRITKEWLLKRDHIFDNSGKLRGAITPDYNPDNVPQRQPYRQSIGTANKGK